MEMKAMALETLEKMARETKHNGTMTQKKLMQ